MLDLTTDSNPKRSDAGRSVEKWPVSVGVVWIFCSSFPLARVIVQLGNIYVVVTLQMTALKLIVNQINKGVQAIQYIILHWLPPVAQDRETVVERYNVKVLSAAVDAMIIKDAVRYKFRIGHVSNGPCKVRDEGKGHSGGVKLPSPLHRIHTKPHFDSVVPSRVKAAEHIHETRNSLILS